MMRFIVSKSIQFRFLVLAIACALMYFGMRELQNAQVDVFPEFAPPRVEIQVPSVGLSAKEVEELVTIPIEDALNGVEGLDVMRSKSVQSLSAINLIFKRGTDLLQGPSAGRRTAVDGGADLAVLDEPAGADAGTILDQPLHEDRNRLRHAVAQRPFDDQLLEDPGAPLARARGLQRDDLWRAHQDVRGAGRAGKARSA